MFAIPVAEVVIQVVGEQFSVCIQRVVDPDANIIVGMANDAKMENEVKITVIATGFPTSDNMRQKEDQLKALLKDALGNDEAEIDLPPFLRRISKYRDEVVVR